MSMSVDGLVSGMDTTSIISQLMQTEAAPQNALKTKLTATQSAASAYRTVNTTFLAVTAAADAPSSPTCGRPTKATSSSHATSTASASTRRAHRLADLHRHAARVRARGREPQHRHLDGGRRRRTAPRRIEVFDKAGVSKGTHRRSAARRRSPTPSPRSTRAPTA